MSLNVQMGGGGEFRVGTSQALSIQKGRLQAVRASQTDSSSGRTSEFLSISPQKLRHRLCAPRRHLWNFSVHLALGALGFGFRVRRMRSRQTPSKIAHVTARACKLVLLDGGYVAKGF